ncbi:Tubulin--tyrosine ligase [Gossypium arboreum]|uniref:Tubulin--tyrosine ligase n=5 Tax=Gossypium TaxID=3633 RepID=A0A0B0NX75_GOSAR|nr:uncharacterized protein LOC107940756 [Gossypium hirsutum]XP_017633169.1 uncharacterized protein LOC108475698 [Gossypium arboreum]TYI37304.1 hypothetical protein ES332_A03G202700v1 [Gossypium tomentosum]TYJ43947.1 hypothetical protein E1A91_A03G188000v1 [Gossypium mustelinum]KAG4209038.1 hypothetical protein ERO13_A03G170200v2 [Gossypium hirsutum]KHG17237.1 Tubulin--tyrosine ligase [Gossypium arboreum]
MEDCMRLSMRKLALWYTKTFKPLMTHDELDHIMATMGFVALPPVQPTCSTVAWKEYVYMASPGRSKSSSSCLSGSCEPSTVEPPRPKLPYPRIDGLHIYTYRAFLDAVNFYLEMCDISELFHIRGMPLHRSNDRSRKWRCMEEDDGVFVYREGTLEQTTYKMYHFNKLNSNSCNGYNGAIVIRDKGNNNKNNTPVSCFVPLKDIIV